MQLIGISIDIRLLLNFVYIMYVVIAFNSTVIIWLCGKELPRIIHYFVAKY